MALQNLARVGQGGSGLQDAVPAAMVELQGLTTSVVAGVAANALAAQATVRLEDTIQSAVMFAAGVPSDVKATATIADIRAFGTITFVTAVADNTVTVNGKVYTAKVTPSTDPNSGQFAIGANDTATAANLAALINNQQGDTLIATSAVGVVTVIAAAEGVGGNAYTLTKVGAPISVSGAVFSGGAATGGFKNSVNTTSNTVIYTWFNKK